MARTFILLGIDTKGKSSQVSGSEVPIPDTLKLFEELRASGRLPEGLVQVQLVEIVSPRIAFDELNRRVAASMATVEAAERIVTTCKETLQAIEARRKARLAERDNVPAGLDAASIATYKAQFTRAISEKDEQIRRAQLELDNANGRLSEAKAEHLARLEAAKPPLKKTK